MDASTSDNFNLCGTPEATLHSSANLLASVFRADAVGAFTSGSQLAAPVVNFVRPFFSPFGPLLGAVDRTLGGLDFEVRWQEFNNKLDIFLLVPSVECRLGIRPRDNTPLSELVHRAYALGQFLSVWSVEGLGHYFGNQALARDEHPRGLLTDPAAGNLPDGSLTMLNAGIGLSFAQKLFERVGRSTPAAAVGEAVRKVVELDRENATPGYEGAAYESLGLVIRQFHPRLVQIVSRQVEQLVPEIWGYYWRGVGRSTYFAPENLVPCGDIDFKTVANLAPEDWLRHNFVAGLAWAITLVNMLTPRVMANLLAHQGDVVSQNDAFADGVASAIIMRWDTTPDADFVKAFINYQPDASGGQLAALWASQIEQPGTMAVDVFYPKLKQHHLLGEVFQYHPLAELGELPFRASGATNPGAATASAT